MVLISKRMTFYIKNIGEFKRVGFGNKEKFRTLEIY